MDELPFERMDVFKVAVELVELAGGIGPIRGSSDLCDQLARASSSVVLNCAEASGKDGADRRRFYAIARGSALETAAALRIMLGLRLIPPSTHDRGRNLCTRLYAMLTRLSGKSA